MGILGLVCASIKKASVINFNKIKVIRYLGEEVIILICVTLSF